MKNLENFGVQEISTKEAIETVGGNNFWARVAWGIYDAVSQAQEYIDGVFYDAFTPGYLKPGGRAAETNE